jgi:hypothetical protein
MTRDELKKVVCVAQKDLCHVRYRIFELEGKSKTYELLCDYFWLLDELEYKLSK